MPSYANQTERLQKQSIPVFPTQTSFTQLFGDTFATNPASSLYLLEDINSAIAGTSLTNNNAVTFDQVTDLTIKPINIATFDGVNQYLSLPTEASVEVGLGSFVASCQFKTNSNATQYLFQYGTGAASEQQWGVFFINGVMEAFVDDGTVTVVIDDVGQRWIDDKWHTASLIVDQVTNFMYLLVDGELIGSANIVNVTGTLTNAGTNLSIGAGNTSLTPTSFFTGQQSNFSLYFPDTTGTLPPDYNLPSLLDSGLRESAMLGTLPIAINTSNRLNNQVGNLSPSDLDYSTSVINTSEGIYDLIFLHREANFSGICEISIDGEIIFSKDLYNVATIVNVTDIISDLYLSGGTHIIKIGVNGQNISSSGFRVLWNMLELIKRDGGNEGDNEATSGILFGDELNQRVNGTWDFPIDTLSVYNEYFLNTSGADGDYREGDLFLKKGLYRFTIRNLQAGSNANMTLEVGGVKVIDNVVTSGSTERNVIVFDGFVFIEGGKTPIRLSASSAGDLQTNYIRFELVSGRGDGDTVNIWSVDNDFQVVSGETPAIAADVSERFNQNLAVNIANDALNDEILFPRYFSGGTYKVKWLTVPTSLGGICDVFWDDAANLIFDDESINSVGGSTIHEATVTIPRGLRDIHIKVVGDGGTNAFLYVFTLMQFTKIADIESNQDDNSDPVHGALVPLGSDTLSFPKSSVTFDLGGIELATKYSEVQIIASFQTSASADVRVRVNGFTADYFLNGWTSGASLVNINDSANANVVVITSAMAGAASQNYFKMTIAAEDTGSFVKLGGTFESQSKGSTSGARGGGWRQNTNNSNFLNQVIVELSTGTMGSTANGIIALYGVKR